MKNLKRPEDKSAVHIRVKEVTGCGRDVRYCKAMRINLKEFVTCSACHDALRVKRRKDGEKEG